MIKKVALNILFIVICCRNKIILKRRRTPDEILFDEHKLEMTIQMREKMRLNNTLIRSPRTSFIHGVDENEKELMHVDSPTFIGEPETRPKPASPSESVIFLQSKKLVTN